MVLCALALAVHTISLTITPAVCFEPCYVRYLVRVEPQPDNRAICIGYDSDDGMSRSACWEIEGERAPKTTQVTWPDITAGTYTAWAAVYRTGDAEKPKKLVMQPFLVIGKNPQPSTHESR